MKNEKNNNTYPEKATSFLSNFEYFFVFASFLGG